MDGNPDHTKRRRWPRPLRSRDRIVGLEHLTAKEMRQLRMGSFFLFEMLKILARQICCGGLYVMEHPGPPTRDDRASAWSTALALLFRAHPAVALHVLGQWRWGSSTVKPTGFLTLRLPRFLASMFARTQEGVTYPCQEAIGVGEDGAFKTASLKEYSSQLCCALSGAFTDEIERKLRSGDIKLAAQLPSGLDRWVHEAFQEASVARASATFKPDYQSG